VPTAAKTKRHRDLRNNDLHGAHFVFPPPAGVWQDFFLGEAMERYEVILRG
jgi:hypothetical protein